MCNDTLIRSLSTFTHVHFRNSVQWRNRKWRWFNGVKSKAVAFRGCVRSPNTWSGRRKCTVRGRNEGIARIYFNAYKKEKKVQRVTPR